MSMEIKGRCTQVLPVQTGMGKKGQWRKLEFVIETNSQYPKKVCLALWGDKVNNTPAVGDELTCGIDLESREHNSRWFTEVRCWKIEGFTGNLNKRSSQQQQDDWGSGKTDSNKTQDDMGDLPF